jgi:hypothetical protein
MCFSAERKSSASPGNADLAFNFASASVPA